MVVSLVSLRAVLNPLYGFTKYSGCPNNNCIFRIKRRFHSEAAAHIIGNNTKFSFFLSKYIFSDDLTYTECHLCTQVYSMKVLSFIIGSQYAARFHTIGGNSINNVFSSNYILSFIKCFVRRATITSLMSKTNIIWSFRPYRCLIFTRSKFSFNSGLKYLIVNIN